MILFDVITLLNAVRCLGTNWIPATDDNYSCICQRFLISLERVAINDSTYEHIAPRWLFITYIEMIAVLYGCLLSFIEDWNVLMHVELLKRNECKQMPPCVRYIAL